ncbi:MAG TPA: hypothetical protein VF168_08855 [Trueperaceae bacterium]
MAARDQLGAEIAARLARSVAGRGVVCSGCLADWTGERSLLTVSRAPFARVWVELAQVLLLVTGDGVDERLLRAAANATVPEVWLIGESRLLTALSLPSNGLYRQRSMILPGERVRLVGLPGAEVVPLTEL